AMPAPTTQMSTSICRTAAAPSRRTIHVAVLILGSEGAAIAGIPAVLPIIVACGQALFYKSVSRCRGRRVETGRSEGMASPGKKHRDAARSGGQQGTLERFQAIIRRVVSKDDERSSLVDDIA